MFSLPKTLVYTRDPKLEQRIRGLLHGSSTVNAIASPEDLQPNMAQLGPSVVFIDLLAREFGQILAAVREHSPNSVPIVLGESRSGPGIDAMRQGAFAIEERDCPRSRLRSLCSMGFQQVKQRLELDDLREQNLLLRHAPQTTQPGATHRILNSLLGMLRLMQRPSSADTLLGYSLDRINEEIGLGAIGVFYEKDGAYQLHHSAKCPKEVSSISFWQSDPLIQWLRTNPAPIQRATLASDIPSAERQLATAVLNACFADTIIPLYRKGALLGWIFFGKSTCGSKVLQENLGEICAISDQLGRLLECQTPEALPETSNTVRANTHTQKKVAPDTGFQPVLDALEMGVVVFDARGIVLWINRSAQTLLGISPDKVVGHPCDYLKIGFEQQVVEARNDRDTTLAWHCTSQDGNNELAVEVHIHRDPTSGISSGFAIIREIPTSSNGPNGSPPKIVTGRAPHPDRLSPNDINLSEEIRRPLLTINTFAQLLPERYDDANFRNTFTNLISEEITRLQSLLADRITKPSNRSLSITNNSIPQKTTRPISKKSGITLRPAFSATANYPGARHLTDSTNM